MTNFNMIPDLGQQEMSACIWCGGCAGCEGCEGCQGPRATGDVTVEQPPEG